MQHPITFAYHVGKNLVLNGVEIYHETALAMQDYSTGDFEGFGQ